MIYFPFDFMFLGTDRFIENGLSGGWVKGKFTVSRLSRCEHGVAAAQMVEPDPEPAPADGEISI